MPKTPLQTALGTLAALNRDELLELRSAIDDLLAALGDAETVQEGTSSAALGTNGARGYIEAKMIPDKKSGKAYGPYYYLRVWKGKTLTSRYLGKDKPGR